MAPSWLPHLSAVPICSGYTVKTLIKLKTDIFQVLRVHQEEEQQVVFEEGNEDLVIENQRLTELTQFFEHNKNIGPEEWLRYVDMPKKYTWNKQRKTWKKRVNKSDTIGRVDNVHPAAGDSFYLRMLLNSDFCKGKQGFEDLRTVDTDICATYKEACEKLGMLQDDHEWEIVLEEAGSNTSCSNIRNLYLTIALWCEPANPKALFDQFWLQWTDDLVAKARTKGVILNPQDEGDQQRLKTLVLLDLKQKLYISHKELADIHLIDPTEEEEAAVVGVTGSRSVVVRDELDFNVQLMETYAQNASEKYTTEQAAIHNKVIEAVKSKKGKCIFIKARGGCGKTFLLNGLLATVRSLEVGGCVALATATTGKAARHLLKGRTFHSRFKAPLILSDNCKLRIPVQTELAKLIKMAKIILVDEVTMMDNRLLQALNDSLCDIMATDLPFGDKVLVISGDFRQTLPIVKGASRAGIVSRCINQHPLWQHFEVMELSVNMRVMASDNPQLIAWDKWLQQVSDWRKVS